MFRRLLLLPVALSGAVLALAQLPANPPASANAAAAPATPDDDRPFFSRVSGLFTGDLPQLDFPGTVKLIVRPHFGDLVHRDYMRMETGLRWAINDDFELNGDTSEFFTHGLKGSAGYGIGRLRFGAKYVFEEWPWPYYETTIALNVERPVGHPPLDMTDGHNHVQPSFIIQHQVESNPRLTTFGGMGLDLMGQSSVTGQFGTNNPHDDNVSVTGGFIYDRGQVKWTFTSTYATTAILTNETHHFFSVQPGLLWYVPRRYTFHSKTQWIVGLGARTSFGPDGTDLSISSKLRAEITFRQVMDRLRHVRENPKNH